MGIISLHIRRRPWLTPPRPSPFQGEGELLSGPSKSLRCGAGAGRGHPRPDLRDGPLERGLPRIGHGFRIGCSTDMWIFPAATSLVPAAPAQVPLGEHVRKEEVCRTA